MLTTFSGYYGEENDAKRKKLLQERESFMGFEVQRKAVFQGFGHLSILCGS